MKAVFERSEEAHQASMAAMAKEMTVEKAVAILEKSDSRLKDEVAKVANVVLQGKSALRKQPKGYAGITGARNLLNSMIKEAFEKYDKEILRCVDFYKVQCAALLECRGQIAAANYIAANGRTLVLDSQARINWAEEEIPTKKYELKVHNAKCDAELARMNARLKIVLADLDVMTIILEMTDCEKATLLQNPNVNVMKCDDQCTKK